MVTSKRSLSISGWEGGCAIAGETRQSRTAKNKGSLGMTHLRIVDTAARRNLVSEREAIGRRIAAWLRCGDGKFATGRQDAPVACIYALKDRIPGSSEGVRPRGAAHGCELFRIGHQS